MQDDKKIGFTEKLAAAIIDKFAEKLSLFGLAHTFHLLEYKHPPLERSKLYGSDLLSIYEAISKYISHSQSEFFKFEKLVDVREQTRHDPDKDWSISPAILQKYQAVRTKLPDPDNDWFKNEHEKRKTERRRRPATSASTLQPGGGPDFRDSSARLV